MSASCTIHIVYFLRMLTILSCRSRMKIVILGWLHGVLCADIVALFQFEYLTVAFNSWFHRHKFVNVHILMNDLNMEHSQLLLYLASHWNPNDCLYGCQTIVVPWFSLDKMNNYGWSRKSRLFVGWINHHRKASISQTEKCTEQALFFMSAVYSLGHHLYFIFLIKINIDSQLTCSFFQCST